MTEGSWNRSLWAIEGSVLGEVLQSGAIEAIMPQGLSGLLGFARGGAGASGAADPVRTGSTLVLNLAGVLSPLGSYGGTSTERFAAQILEAADDERIGLIVIKVMSPGGLVWGTQEAADAVMNARLAKPVIAVADKYAFSAAHWIACSATAFFATPSGQVGSVGVRGGHVDMTGLEHKIGIKTTLIASNPKKVAAHPYAPLNDDDRAEMQAEIDEMARAFKLSIAKARGLRLGSVSDVHGSGEVFSAKRALARGAIDGVMTLNDVLLKYSSSEARRELMRKRARQMGSLSGISPLQ